MTSKAMLSHRHSHIIIILLSVLVGMAVAAMVIYSPVTHKQITPPATARDFFKQFPWPFGLPEQEPGEKPKEIPFKTESLGSGWIYREDGYIVTNTHVVEGGTDFQVQLFDQEDDRKYKAKLIGKDPKTDLAVLKVDVGRKLPTLSLGSSADAQVGQWVMAVGTPFGLDQTVTAGIISAKGRFLPGLREYIRLGDIIQTVAGRWSICAVR